MVKLIRRRPRERRRQYASYEVTALCTGLPLGCFGNLRHRDLPAICDAWLALRDDLLPLFVLHHPGRRPWIWWHTDAPEPMRRQTRGVPWSTHRLANHWSRQITFGVPDSRDGSQEFESEHAYLSRLWLLLPSELGVQPHTGPLQLAWIAQHFPASL